KNNVHFFQGMIMEEHLKMTSSYPLFHETITSDHIMHSWGEIQNISSSDTCNEKSDPFKKARIGKKVDMKAMLLKTSNKFEALFGEVSGGLGPFGVPTACRKKRLEIIVYGWLQFGIYRFGLIDRCRIPADTDDCDILEDAYCILKLLESKLLDTERAVKNLFSNNTKGKR
ncbi:14270_t:CDS:2, partial [Funneliformis mosseae]